MEGNEGEPDSETSKTDLTSDFSSQRNRHGCPPLHSHTGGRTSPYSKATTQKNLHAYVLVFLEDDVDEIS